MSKKETGISSILINEKELENRVRELAKQISDDYRNNETPPCLIALLKGSFVFMADLCRYIDIAVEIDFMSVSSYGNDKVGAEVKILKDVDVSLAGKDVIIVEDIIDSGFTLEKICELFRTRDLSSLKICTLLNKPSRRKVDIKVDYNGFDIEDLFIVGYGIDYAEKYRNLPYIAVV